MNMMTFPSKIKVLFHSNHSKFLTGFGKNMKNILLALHNDPAIEVIEAANGLSFGADAKTPWKTYGTIPSDPSVIQEIQTDPHKSRNASYGHFCIDKIIEESKPDIYIGIEDIWAFRDFPKRSWWPTTKNIIWTTLDSLPILEDTFTIAPQCDKFLVWASFAEKELKNYNNINVETLHGAVDYSNFFPINNRNEIRNRLGINDEFIIGFVFKNQLRKSVPNLLDGFKIFKQNNPQSKAKLLLHTDWEEISHGWNIPKFLKEKDINISDVLCTYVCANCRSFHIRPYSGENKHCEYCGNENSCKTKNNGFGVSEEQLNEIYNCMDVYCHPFTSGGQELPIQEAKAAGLITLVTEYSCGTDSCYEHQGGIPLEWNEYREPFTQFIKATTCPKDIAKKLDYVYNIDESTKSKLIKNAQNHVFNNFSVEKIANKLKQIIIDTYYQDKKNEKLEENKQDKILKIEDLLDKEAKDRILIVMPQSYQDIFMLTSLLPSFKETYPEKDIYIATLPEFMEVLDGNPYIYKVIPFVPIMENLLAMEGTYHHNGYFELCFIPYIGTQKIFDYQHNNSSDKIMFELHSEKFNNQIKCI